MSTVHCDLAVSLDGYAEVVSSSHVTHLEYAPSRR